MISFGALAYKLALVDILLSCSKYQTFVHGLHMFWFGFLVLYNILIFPVHNDNTAFCAAFPWLCPAFCDLHSWAVDVAPLCRLPILSGREPGSLLGLRRKPHKKCEASLIFFLLIHPQYDRKLEEMHMSTFWFNCVLLLYSFTYVNSVILVFVFRLSSRVYSCFSWALKLFFSFFWESHEL